MSVISSIALFCVSVLIIIIIIAPFIILILKKYKSNSEHKWKRGLYAFNKIILVFAIIYVIMGVVKVKNIITDPLPDYFNPMIVKYPRNAKVLEKDGSGENTNMGRKSYSYHRLKFKTDKEFEEFKDNIIESNQWSDLPMSDGISKEAEQNPYYKSNSEKVKNGMYYYICGGSPYMILAILDYDTKECYYYLISYK